MTLGGRRVPPRRIVATVARLLLVLLIHAAAATAAVADSAPTVASEYDVKAAFLYKFTEYVEWPADAPARTAPSFVICIIGSDPLGSALEEAVRGRSRYGKPFVVMRHPKASDAKDCAVAFISGNGAESSQLRKLRRQPVLTVGETAEFAEHGGMIGFYFDENRLRFAINAAVAQDAGLEISSRLLRLSRIVDGGQR